MGSFGATSQNWETKTIHVPAQWTADQQGSAHQRDASSGPPLGTINFILATPGRTDSYPFRVMSIAWPYAEDLIPDPKRVEWKSDQP